MLVENGMSHHSLVALLYAFINSCNKVKIKAIFCRILKIHDFNT